MPVGFVGVSNLIATNGGAPGAITPHANTVNGNLLVFFHYSRATGGNETVSPPAGWNLVFNSVTANQGLVAVYWRIRQSGDTTYTFTITNHTSSNSGETVLEWIETYDGHNATTPIVNVTASLSTWASSTTIGSISAPSSANVNIGDMVVVFGGRFENVTGQTVLTGDSLTWAARTINDSNLGLDAGAVTQNGLNGTSGDITVTAKSITTTGTAQAGAGIMFVIEVDQLTKSLSDTVTLTDAITKQVEKSNADTISLTDSVIKELSKTFADSATLTDSITSLQLQKELNLGDSISFTDQIAQSFEKNLSDSLSLVDAAIKEVSKSFDDSIILTDLSNKSFDKGIQDNITLSESIVKQVEKSNADSITFNESSTKENQKSLSDNLSFIDQSIKQSEKLLSDSVSLVDDSTKQVEKQLSDNIVLTDAVSKVIIKSVADIVSLQDQLSKTSHKILADSIVIQDSLYKDVALFLQDNIGLVDQYVKQLEKSINDSLGLVDEPTLDLQGGGGGGQLLFLDLSDMISFVDQVDNKVIQKLLTDNTSFTDQLNKVIEKSINEDIVFVDNQSKIAFIIQVDNVNFTDQVSKQPYLNFQDSISISDICVVDHQPGRTNVLLSSEILVELSLDSLIENVVFLNSNMRNPIIDSIINVEYKLISTIRL